MASLRVVGLNLIPFPDMILKSFKTGALMEINLTFAFKFDCKIVASSSFETFAWIVRLLNFNKTEPRNERSCSTKINSK